jgi:hypothetical protein
MDSYYSRMTEKGVVPFLRSHTEDDVKADFLFSPYEGLIIVASEYGSITFVKNNNITANTVGDEKIINIYSSAILMNESLQFSGTDPIAELFEECNTEIADIILRQVVSYLIDFRKENSLID